MALDEHFSSRTRAYQQEMFDRSMEGNKIIVMDTGSGKTQVALLRVQAELDRCASHKRVWFLAPSVELCIQQHNVFEQALPAYKTQLLTGQDNVDKWSDQRTWDAALDQARIVISTHAVLRDALVHGFVRLQSISLLVYDEAHHCSKKHPANAILQDFYHPIKAVDGDVPHILGLSASLVNSSNLKSVSTIEANLDSVSVTPRIERQELIRHVSQPKCSILRYRDGSDAAVSSGIRALAIAISQHVAHPDEVVIPGSSRYDSLRAEQRTLRKFYEKAQHILVELGASAADYFIRETIAFLRKKLIFESDFQLDVSDSIVRNVLMSLNAAQVEQACHQETTHFPVISNKVQCLLRYLLSDDKDDICGIVFVKQRIVASVLSTMLNDVTLTGGKMHSVPSVGSSGYSGKKYSITELLDKSKQKQALDTFRQGHTNIVVATSVLEEGIDVQACNVVACFDLPDNLKSYIQRRGRARQKQSRYGLLLEEDAEESCVYKWRQLEQDLVALCQEERRQAEYYRQLEEEDESPNYLLEIEATGARLDATAALQHLYHFCQILHKDHLQDARPPFTYEEDKHSLVTATVTLPSSVPARIRQISSKKSWRTQRAARKDAAFHAYKALYEVGLLDNHLLPIVQQWNVNEGLYEMAPPPRMQFGCMNLWKPVEDHNDHFKIEIRITPPDTYVESPTDLQLITYTQMSLPPELELHWDAMSTFKVRFDAGGIRPIPSDLIMMHNFTTALYRAPRSDQHWQVDDQLLTFFQPMHEEAWMHDVREHPLGNLNGILRGSLIRITYRHKAPYIYLERTADGQVRCAKLPRRRNFLSIDSDRKVEVDDSLKPCVHEARTDIFPSSQCTIESMPLRWARIGLFIPNILQHISDYTIVEKLRSGLLYDVRLQNRGLIRAAITTGSAQRAFDYQRLEFIGDSVLKHVITCHLYHTHQDWPEGYLTQRRSVLVCNATLACSAYKAGLGQFIISTPVDHRNWTFPSAEIERPQTELSSKTLADVVEALIGAAWLEAGFEAARRCVNVFLPTMSKVSTTNTSAPSSNDSIGNIKQVQSIIGYEFTNPALLIQALTHPSYANVARAESYERLEFLGDAVLDMIVVNLLARHLDKLSQGKMTAIKAASVNADLLGFLCLNLKSEGMHRVVVSNDESSKEPQITTKVFKRSLADCIRVQPYLRLDSVDKDLHNVSHKNIIFQLEHGHGHPWGMLRELKISKMYSDVVESVLAAIYLDSGQDFDACESFLRRLGLLQYAERVISEDLDVRNCPPLPEEEQRSPGAFDGDVTSRDVQ